MAVAVESAPVRRGRRRLVFVVLLILVLAAVAGGVAVLLARGGPRATLRYQGAAFGVAAYSPDGHTVATGGGGASTGGLVVLWETGRWRSVAALRTGSGGPVVALAYSPDGALLAAAGTGSQGGIGLWDVAGRRLLATLPGAGGDTEPRMAFTPDGKSLVVTGESAGVRIWDVAGRQAVATLGADPSARAVAVSPDGRLLAAAGKGSVALWDLTTRQQVATLADPGAGYLVDAVAFSPDGRSLAVGAYLPELATPVDHPGHTTLWDVAGRSRVATFAVSGNGSVRAVAFSPDGRRVASGGSGPSDNTQLTLWDVATRGVVRKFPAEHRALWVASLAFSARGDALVAAASGGDVQVWGL